MKIAIIGGGAAGLVTAYLLRDRHELTLFEKQEVLGGNIRTLGVNVPCVGLEAGLVLDAGVIEFEEDRFTGVRALLDELAVKRHEAPGTTALHLADGRSFRSLGNIAAGTAGPSVNRLRCGGAGVS